MNISPQIHSPVTHALMYAALLVFTPFIMLQNFLQRSITDLSEMSIYPFGLRIPLVFGVVAVGFIVFLVHTIINRKLTRTRVIAVLFCLFMVFIGQRICDFYSGNPFYDLQNNWHYIAYAIFAFFYYRAINKPYEKWGSFLFRGYLIALTLSLFDEIFQFFLSNRVFDLSDVAKDGWGMIIGLILVIFVLNNGKNTGKFSLKAENLSSYFRNVWSSLILIWIFSFIFMIVSSHLSARRFVWHVAGITLGIFIIVFILIWLSKNKILRIIIIFIFTLAFVALGVSRIIHRDDLITHHSYGLVVYRGIPIPFFDIMIFPDGGFRIVDKKHYFNPGDRKALLEKKADIVIVSSGYRGMGARGLGNSISEFGYNPFIDRNTQIIILITPEAIKTYNRLRREGKKNILFVIHTTC